jgi:hypothetical protein
MVDVRAGRAAARARRLVALAVALALAAACGAGGRSPSATVRAYFEATARDPVRSLALLTPDFQRNHGLRFDEVRDDPVIDVLVEARPGTQAWARGAAPETNDPDLELQRAMLGWLTALGKPAFARRGPLAVVLEAERVQGDRASVRAHARLRRRAPFALDFSLARAAPGAPWRIDAIAIEDEARVDPVSAFLAAPSAERYRRLMQRPAPRRPAP